MMELITERLILRDFVEGDWPAVLAYSSDPRYLRYYEWTERTPEQVQAFVQMFLRGQQGQPRIKFQLALVLKHNGQLIGNCGIRKDTPDARQADIGYELAPDYWGQGYATEAARAVVRFGFSELRVHRIWADCVADNVGSTRVLEKIGMRREGHLRENQYYKGRWWDTLLYGILESAWRGL
jgi:RimJ/RimL family protein N-acetyltransferase